VNTVVDAPVCVGPCSLCRGSEQLASGSRSAVVEVLQELMGGELDLLVSPLGRAVMTSDQSHPVDAPEVPIDECVSGLGVVARAVGESQMPCGVLAP
jgi:hypothetical protein